MLNLLYPLVRSALFCLDPEKAHYLTFSILKYLHRIGLYKIFSQTIPANPRTLMGITFPNPIGLAAGLDKDGKYIDVLAALGFGFLEIGTITPRPQNGNPQPRLFRLPKAQVLINRMGFNNGGVDAFVSNIQHSVFAAQGGILGLNIGKNVDTPMERAHEDYLYCLDKVYPYASYITINISSPNTHNLRELQNEEALEHLLALLKARQQKLADKYQRYIPLVIKIAPDLTQEQIQTIAITIMRHKIDGVIATNTTLSRAGVSGMPYADETGGLSGAPLLDQANFVTRTLRATLGPDYPIIGVGGVLSNNDALSKRDSGANLIQIYTGLIYRGPQLIHDCAQAFTYN